MRIKLTEIAKKKNITAAVTLVSLIKNISMAAVTLVSLIKIIIMSAATLVF